jgi:hypothetical protein
MPDYIMNELVFCDLSDDAIAEIEALTVNAQGVVDFNILLPLPDRLRGEWRDGDILEVISIWGTKYNAQANPPFKMIKKLGDGRLILRFLTANNKPWLWMMALLTKLRVSVQYTWCWEGQFGWQSTFDCRSKDPISERKIEQDKGLHKRMRRLYKKATAIRPEPSVEQSQDVVSPSHEVSPSSDDYSKKIDELAWEITHAVTNCPHQIDDGKIVLKFSPKSEGHNALNQLVRRVEAILKSNPALSV